MLTYKGPRQQSQGGMTSVVLRPPPHHNAAANEADAAAPPGGITLSLSAAERPATDTANPLPPRVEQPGQHPGEGQPGDPMSRPRRLLNILGLSIGWCLVVSIMFIQISTSTLAAKDYNGASTSTLPAGATNAAAMLTAIPGTLLMRRYGRRPVMLLPALAAIVGAALMALAAKLRSLWLLCVGSIPLGAQNFRFAALEFSPAEFETHALSLVVTGAMLSSVVGPEVARHTRNAMTTPYMATYIFVVGLCVLLAALVAAIEFGRTPELVAAKVLDTVKEPAAAMAAASIRGLPVLSLEAEEELMAGSDGNVAIRRGRPPPGLVGAPPDCCSSCSSSKLICTTATHVVVQPPHSSAAKDIENDSHSQASGPLPPSEELDGTRHHAIKDPPLGQLVVCHPVAAAPSAVRQPPVSQPAVNQAAAGPPVAAPGLRPLSHLLLSWHYAVPVITASLAYCAMAGMMTASPLIIRDTGYDFDQATQVIQVHILSMFVPSLFTGEVVRLLSPPVTMAAGACLLAAGAALFFVGETLSVYFAGNSLVGLGWNWAYVGASVQVSRSYRPEEKFQAQGVMDALVLLLSGLPSLVAGFLYDWFGWRGYTAVFVAISACAAALDAVFIACCSCVPPFHPCLV